MTPVLTPVATALATIDLTQLPASLGVLGPKYVLIATLFIYIFVQLVVMGIQSVFKKEVPIEGKWALALLASLGSLYIGTHILKTFTVENSLDYLLYMIAQLMGSAGIYDFKAKLFAPTFKKITDTEGKK